MVVGGALNDISADLHVSVSTVGQLIAVAAVMMGTGAPIMATVFSHIDRRYLLSGALVWYGAGHLLCAFCPQYDWLLPVRALTVLAAAVFTPQAAAAMGVIANILVICLLRCRFCLAPFLKLSGELSECRIPAEGRCHGGLRTDSRS